MWFYKHNYIFMGEGEPFIFRDPEDEQKRAEGNLAGERGDSLAETNDDPDAEKAGSGDSDNKETKEGGAGTDQAPEKDPKQKGRGQSGSQGGPVPGPGRIARRREAPESGGAIARDKKEGPGI